MASDRNNESSNRIGWFGWFSVAGFVIMGLWYIAQITVIQSEAVSPLVTLLVALVAGIGAALLYIGNDPTARDEGDRVRTT